ncbi:MAG: hypothetical protein M1832_000346 [Thelocarpon impressellum]|nr:MAG: hypothetical protein M1832_000346 [Thelocarpon impressellum]
MGAPSSQASNAIIYLTYGAFLVLGLYIAWRLRSQTKTQFLSSNGTQKGQDPAMRAGRRGSIPLALNFIASGISTEALGSGILFAYPQIATIAGVQGLVIYALASSLPLLVFGFLGPIIRRKTPHGFVLTEWTRQRYGLIAAWYLSVLTLITIFLYMVAELSALQQIVTALTGMNGLPVVIVECAVTTIYTSLGGFRVSFVTDNIQGAMVVGLIVLGVIAVGATTDVDRSLIGKSGLLDASLLGWQLMYILPVAILTNDFFLSVGVLVETPVDVLYSRCQGFWMRTFASRSDRDLRIGTSIATAAVLCILVLVGSSGLLAAWTGVWPGDPAQEGSIALFLLLEQLPSWVVGVVLVMVVSLSTAAFDSFQSAMVSTASNDFFRNRLGIWWVRAGVVLLIFPVVVVALKSPDILQIFLISDLVSAAAVPVLLIGLHERCYWWRGFEVVVGGLGGILTVFLFGTVYYGNARQGGRLILLEGGLYANDWSVFGAFVAAPVGGLLWGAAAFALRLAFQFGMARARHERFAALDRPAPTEPPFLAADGDAAVQGQVEKTGKGTFF